MKTKVFDVLQCVSLLLFVSFTVYILYINQEVLYTAHDRSEFLYELPFFVSVMSSPFGLMQYAGSWLTQLFYYPALGSCVLLFLWMLIYLVGVKAFRLNNGSKALMLLPIACLLTSIVDLGYWVYISPVRGYWFSQSLSYLIMLLLLWAARCSSKKLRFVWYLLAFCIYPVLGWYALLFVICFAFVEKPTWQELIGVVVLIFTAGIWHNLLYPEQKMVVLAGLPNFENPLDSSSYITVPFWGLGALSIIYPLCSRYLAKVYMPVLCAVFGAVFTLSLMFRDKTYLDEMRMVHYAEDDNWSGVLKIASATQKPTTSMVILKNIALMNQGGLLDRSFKLSNSGEPIYNPDSIHVSFLNIVAPLAYYNYGLMNESVRLDFENAVQTGFSPFCLKVLSRCALATGDTKLLERYTTLLSNNPFYSDWEPANVTEKVSELQTCFSDELTGVENSDSYLVNSMCLWYDSESKLASEQALLYSMIRCDSHCFWESLRKYIKLHQGEEFPLYAQEAYILFMDKSPEKKRMMLPVEESIYERYQQFWKAIGLRAKPGVTVAEVMEDIRDEWGDTYWFYNIFGRKIH